MKFRGVIWGAILVMFFCMINGENFEIQGLIRYNSNKRTMSVISESKEESQDEVKDEAKEALARKDAPYNICMAIFLGVAAIIMIILILTAPKKKDKGE